MAMKLINESSLVAIGDAIRAKTGSSLTYSPSEMVTAIGNISGGGQTVETLPSSFLSLTGNLSNCFSGVYGKKMAQILYLYSSNITTTDVTNIDNFYTGILVGTPTENTDLSHITLNFYSNADNNYSQGYSARNAFSNSNYLKYLPVFSFNIENGSKGYLSDTYQMFSYCSNLISVEQFMNNTDFIQDSSSAYRDSMFNNCVKITSIPHLEKLRTTASYRHQLYYYGLCNCYSLNEALNVPVSQVTLTNNGFTGFVSNCYTLGRFTFETNNGTPYTANWKNQVLDLTESIGYGNYQAANSIGTVTDATTYEQYKNGIYNTALLAYSRYNHTSAVETINSLPDCSSSGGTNTIKFKSGSGASTDGGDVANLTNAEIAVATNKAWTVQIV